MKSSPSKYLALALPITIQRKKQLVSWQKSDASSQGLRKLLVTQYLLKANARITLDKLKNKAKGSKPSCERIIVITTI